MPEKWNKDASAVDNLLSLYTLLLFEEKKFSLTELAKKFNVSKPTMLRYVAQLEASKFCKVLVEKHGRENLYFLERPYALPKTTLSVEGLVQVSLCRDFMRHILPIAMQKNIDTLLHQASAYLPQQQREYTEETLAKLPIHTESFARSFSRCHINYGLFHKQFQAIIEAIQKKEVCLITYKKDRKYKAETFDYAPQQIVLHKESILIFGFKVTAKGEVEKLYTHPNTLALHRITKVETTNRFSYKIAHFREYAKGAFGLMDNEEEKEFLVKIQFDAKVATYIEERIWSKNQSIVENEDQSITLNFYVRSKVELKAWVLGFGSSAKILSPAWLRKEIMEEAKKIAQFYV